MPSQFAFVAPRTSTPRPPLPLTCANPLIKNIDRAKLPQVKYQVITREGQEIVVGRIKIQTPGGGHAFILRRFDTGAISLTTMFRAAFPSAPEDAERAEAAWVKANYDMPGTNGAPATREASARLRLAGTWVSPDVAVSIADVYALGHVVPPLAGASPDPAQEYRKSTKGSSPGAGAANGSPARVAVPLPQASPGPNPSKRRKEASPAPAPVSALAPAPVAAEPAPVPTPASPPTAAPPARRSAPPSKGAKPPSRVTRAALRAAPPQAPLTPAPSDQAYVDEDGDVADVPGPDISADVAEQQALIAGLKAQRAAAAAAGSVAATPARPKVAKRTLEDAEQPLQFAFKEPEAGLRAIRTNRRITLEPQQKSAVWGVALFAFGFAAMTALPSFLF